MCWRLSFCDEWIQEARRGEEMNRPGAFHLISVFHLRWNRTLSYWNVIAEIMQLRAMWMKKKQKKKKLAGKTGKSYYCFSAVANLKFSGTVDVGYSSEGFIHCVIRCGFSITKFPLLFRFKIPFISVNGSVWSLHLLKDASLRIVVSVLVIGRCSCGL